MSSSSMKVTGTGLPPLAITEIKLRFVQDGRDGLLAWASCVLNGTVILNNIAVRRGREGGLMLTYPAKQTAAGARFYYFNPISSDAAAIIEAAIGGKLRELIATAGTSTGKKAD